MLKILMSIIVGFVNLVTPSISKNNFVINYENKNSINLLIVEEAFENSFHNKPAHLINENFRIKTHLTYVENKLRKKVNLNLNSQQINRRNLMLYLLKEYISIGKFPQNYDYKNERKPTFLDKNGNICAVGYLILKTSGSNLVNEINKEFKYSYIYEMNNNNLNSWVSNSGLTIDELQMIQPNYGDIPLIPFIVTLGTIFIIGTVIVIIGISSTENSSKENKYKENKMNLSLIDFENTQRNDLFLENSDLKMNTFSYSIIKF